MKPLLRRLPTTDLYFAHALPHVAQKSGRSLPPVRQIGRHCFLMGRVAIVSRYVHPIEVAIVKMFKPDRVVYLIDDDLGAGISDHGLSKGYRKRLQNLKDKGLKAVLDITTDIIVPSEPLKEQFDDIADVHLLHPLWHRPFADLSHFPDVVSGQAPFKIAFLGTRSHLPDLATIQFELARLLKAYPKLEFHHRLGKEAPKVLASLPNAIAAPQVGWRTYREWIGTERFHLALYPLRPTKFNKARSTNKLFEHALTGAASLMSPSPATKDMLKGSLEEIFIEGDEQEWAKRIERFIENPILAQTLTARTLMHLNALDITNDHVEVWRKILRV